MSAAIPAALKTADISRFAIRAGQLEKARPAVAYWCNYWIVEQIISKGLHQADDDSKNYTVRLMDKLEQFKVDFAENDAITDDMAGHAYIEQFGHDTLQRAENAMRANKASRQTADTFQAAATFLELCQIWGPVDPEIASKIKYAKYHALRIAKAIKAGEDPNLTNPKSEPPSEDIEQVTKPAFETQTDQGMKPPSSYQPTVEDTPETHLDHDVSPPREIHQRVEHYYQQPPQPEVSPLDSPAGDQRSPEINGYFPETPKPAHNDLSLPSSPSNIGGGVPSGISAPVSLPSTAPDPSLSTLHSFPPPTRHESQVPEQQQPTYPAPHKPNSGFSPAISHSSGGASVPPLAPPGAIQSRSIHFNDDEASVMAAQKHAKFAISALNFEDVPTAVKELREALHSLGANS